MKANNHLLFKTTLPWGVVFLFISACFASCESPKLVRSIETTSHSEQDAGFSKIEFVGTAYSEYDRSQMIKYSKYSFKTIVRGDTSKFDQEVEYETKIINDTVHFKPDGVKLGIYWKNEPNRKIAFEEPNGQLSSISFHNGINELYYLHIPSNYKGEVGCTRYEHLKFDKYGNVTEQIRHNYDITLDISSPENIAPESLPQTGVNHQKIHETMVIEYW